MPLIFQYGSNLDIERLNSHSRLQGQAKAVGTAQTRECYDWEFNIATQTGSAVSIADSSASGRQIWGALYEIPEDRIFRHLGKGNHPTLDAIEGEGGNYRRGPIALLKADGSPILETVLTYYGHQIKGTLRAYEDYAQHILLGAAAHQLPQEYQHWIRVKIAEALRRPS